MEAARKRRLGLLLFALGVAVATALALVVAHRLGPKHLLTVTPGVLYRSGQLTPEQLTDLIERYGIRTVVNLRSENEMGQGDWHRLQSETARREGARLVDLPMHTGFPPDQATHEAWLGLIEDPVAQPILVHCQYGVLRTGIMVAIYQIERLGLSSEQALERFERFGHEFSETIQGRIDDYFEQYVPRQRRS